MGFATSGRCERGSASTSLRAGTAMHHVPCAWMSPCPYRTCRQAVSAHVRAKPLKCPTCTLKGVQPFVDPEAGMEDGTKHQGCAALEPLFDDRFECPARGNKSLTFKVTEIWHQADSAA